MSRHIYRDLTSGYWWQWEGERGGAISEKGNKRYKLLGIK